MSDPTDLPGILSDAGIRVKSFAPGSTTKTLCPRCHGGNTKEHSLSVTIDRDGDGVAWQCHRGTCGWKEGHRVHDAERRPRKREERVVEAPIQHAPKITQNKPRALYEFFEKRGISAETVDLFGCYVAQHAVPTLGVQPCIVFPYVWQSVVRNRKYRPPQKQPQAQEKNALPTLFNIDAVAAPDRVVWVEGEPDAMAIHEAGYPQVVSLKDGAPAELRAEDDPRRDDDKRFAALDTHAELLAQVETFVLAGDADAPGAVLREELARRLGRHRCLLVTWPAGCKDACDVLRAHGKGVVQQCIEAAKPYPLKGLHTLSETTLVDYWKKPPPQVMALGMIELDRVVKWPGEGRLIVLTGFANAGKSSFARWVMISLMQEHQRRFVVFSPEMQPWEEFALSCAEVWANATVGKPDEKEGVRAMTEAQVVAANAWLAPRLAFLASDAEENPPTLEWIMERARAAALTMGVTDLVIDPWNEIEHQRGALSETDYVSRSLQRLRAFGFRHGLNVWVVAHPAKPAPARFRSADGDNAPALYDISGSAAFANKADIGIVVHNEPGEPTQIILRKSRFRRWGRKGNMAKLRLVPQTGRYMPIEQQDKIAKSTPLFGSED